MKKRGISRVDPNDPSIHARPPFHGAPNSQFHIPKSPLTNGFFFFALLNFAFSDYRLIFLSLTYFGFSYLTVLFCVEVGRQKKVNFVAPQKESSRRSRRSERDYSYVPLEREKVTTCDPKTSEYAFFKKLKKDASLRFPSGPLKRDASPSSKKPESGDCSKERTDDDGVGSKVYNSSRIIQDVSTFKTDSFLLPSCGAWNKSDLYSISGMLKNSENCHDTFKPQGILSHEGNQYVHGEIFSRKRQKLRQCVADLFPDTEKLCSKGHDIVSMLLNRLFPISAVKNKYEDPNPGKVESATRYDLLDSRESGVQFKENYQIPKRKFLELESGSYFNDQLLSPVYQFKENYQIPKRKFLELESGSYFNDQLLSPVFLGSDERVTPHAEFPTYHCHNFQPLYSITETKCKLSGAPSFNASAKGDVTLVSPFNEVANATRYSLLDSREVDVQFTEHHQIPKRKLLELESSSHLNDHLLSSMLLRPVDLITPHANFPIYPPKFQPVFRTEAESKFGGTPSYVDRNDVIHGLLCNEQKHETFTLDHFKELGKIEREPIPLLLEKDFYCTEDEMKLPITCKYAKPDMGPAVSILGHGEEQISNNTLGEYHFSPSSLLLDKPEDFNSVLDSGLLRYQEFRVGKYAYKDSEEMDTNFNHTALSLSHNKHYFKLSENCKIDTSCVQDSIYFPPFHHCVRKAVSSDYRHHADTEAWLPSSLDECQKSLSLTSSRSNYQNPNSRTLQWPQRESMSSLFHIDDNYEPEIDGGNHGEVLYHFSKGLIEMYDSSFLHMSMQRDNGCPFSLDDSDNINEREQAHEMLL